MRLLFICTGNKCRSPIAERLAAARAHELLGADDRRVTIESAGLQAPIGDPMDPRSAKALVALGGDPTGMRSRAFTPDMAAGANLVLTMTRRQRRIVLEAFPRGMRKTFTLVEAAELLGRADLDGLAELPLAQRAAELALSLDNARATRMSADADDILDPIDQRPAVHDEVAAVIAEALRPLTSVLFAGSRAQVASPLAGGAGARD